MSPLPIALLFSATLQAPEAPVPPPPPEFPRVHPVGGLPAGCTWTESQGVDFDVWGAGSEPGAHVGLYLGWHPSFHPGSGGSVTPGILMGRPVAWQVRWRAGGGVRMETLAEGLFPDRRLKVHVWIEASTQTAAEALAHGLASLRLVP